MVVWVERTLSMMDLWSVLAGAKPLPAWLFSQESGEFCDAYQYARFAILLYGLWYVCRKDPFHECQGGILIFLVPN